MEPNPPKAPLFEIHMKLSNRSLDFVPNINEDEDDPESIYGVMSNIIQDINGLALLIPRISYQRKELTYMVRQSQSIYVY
jgi:hypothetical protein